MTKGDFYGSEQSVIVKKATRVKIQHVQVYMYIVCVYDMI